MIEIKERLINKVEEDGNFVRTEDGYWVFWPTRNGGAYQAYHLRIISDELDRRNVEFERELDEL